MSTTTTQIKGAMNMIVAVGDAIRDLGQVPSGELYSNLSGYLTLHDYEAILGILKRAELVREEPSHLLVWTGPAKGGTRQ